jgi:ATP-binding cassette, subfamily B, bacterial PglK
MLKSIHQMLSILDPRTRLHFALLLVPIGVMTALEVVSIGLILPVIQVLILGKTDGELTRMIQGILPTVAEDDFKLWVAGSFSVFFVIKNILLLIMVYIVNHVVTHKTATYQRHIFNAYVSRSLIFHFHNNSAELLRNVTGGIGASMEAIRLSLLMILDGMLMLGALGLLVIVEPVTTIGAGLALGTIAVVFYLTTNSTFRFWGARCMALEGDVIRWINQSLTGIRDVKLFQAQAYLSNKLNHVATDHAKYMARSITTIQIPRLLIETVVVIGFLGIVFMLLSTEKTPDEIVSVLGLFGMAALRLMPSLNRFLSSATEIRRRAAYIDTIHDAFIPNKYDMKSTGQDSKKDISYNTAIELRNLTYTYPDAGHHALTNFNLTINKGTSVGFVGSSGAGKSTLMDIILGFLEPSSGQLLIDGQDAFERIAGWQRKMGFVPQQVFIMDDTVRRNIAFGIEDQDINEKRLEEFLRLTRVDEFVADLPQGLDTMLGEHGTRLSGGQRQRVAIARALYRNPDVLVFDEATSALDNVTEKEISAAIETLSGDKTILIVAHRLSTIRNCDQIVFMKNGAIAGKGTYDELLSSSAEFRHLTQIGNTAPTQEKEIFS